MSSNSITITAQLREITGTNKVRNLRKNEMVPAVIYGNEAEVQKVNIPLNELLKASQNHFLFLDPVGEPVHLHLHSFTLTFQNL